MMNLTIAGNIGKDAVTRTTQAGDKVTSWTVAVNAREGRETRTYWFDCTMWGARGETLAPYLTKGGKVTCCGTLGTREHEGRTYLQLRVAEVTLQGDGGKPREDRPARGGYDQSIGTEAGRQHAPADLDDEIPF